MFFLQNVSKAAYGVFLFHRLYYTFHVSKNVQVHIDKLNVFSLVQYNNKCQFITQLSMVVYQR